MAFLYKRSISQSVSKLDVDRFLKHPVTWQRTRFKMIFKSENVVCWFFSPLSLMHCIFMDKNDYGLLYIQTEKLHFSIFPCTAHWSSYSFSRSTWPVCNYRMPNVTTLGSSWKNPFLPYLCPSVHEKIGQNSSCTWFLFQLAPSSEWEFIQKLSWHPIFSH